jgi:phosphoribosyl-AMP cyclohydrolase
VSIFSTRHAKGVTGTAVPTIPGDPVPGVAADHGIPGAVGVFVRSQNLLLRLRWFSPFDLIMNADFRFTEDGLIPAIVREANPPGRVLMMAWMNRDSIERTLATGLMHYWSRTRQKLWLKGETSGHTQKLIRWFTDCDRDTLLFEVEQVAGACHTGHFSCFFQELDWEANAKPVVEKSVFDPLKAYPK